ncbi:signal recognition particle protein [Methylogaea oryzae]|uniref:Signal recognition particle protein n=1 Tax=Methylogaea oryzae TaxID=1295382 RepID=A0A8D4VP48_9GAMM|nr:signal recognition particle protein [Methylogaea oryzae]BBL71480.1 signal recognition particle protein [Methylogaea oryzae]
MFDNLTQRLSSTLKNIRGQGRLTEENIQESLREIRMSLLEADVALPVVREFIDQVKERALGSEVKDNLNPGQQFIKIVYDELLKVMGKANEGLDLATQPPAVILMAGLQGAGKTTTVAKLAHWIKTNLKKSVGVVSADVYRPAAIQQLQTLAGEVGVDYIASDISQKPVDIVRGAVDTAKKRVLDVLIVDTAGRLHVDEAMMDEIKQVHAAVKPIETLFVVDSMTGQDAANTAKAFHDALPLTGVVLTKADGDARGGAALSIRHITGKPIKFIGVGEKAAAFELFHPERIAQRILGMGDVLSLIEDAERKLDREKADKLFNKVKKGKEFDLDDFRDQMYQLQNMGGVGALMDKLPGMANLSQDVRDKVNERDIIRQIAIVNSMTPKERRYPAVIDASRKRRIARGCGLEVQDVNRLLKQFTQMQKFMKKMNKGNIANLMRGVKGAMRGGLPGMRR